MSKAVQLNYMPELRKFLAMLEHQYVELSISEIRMPGVWFGLHFIPQSFTCVRGTNQNGLRPAFTAVRKGCGGR